MTLQRYRTVEGVEGVATPEYFAALQAVNFMERHGFGWILSKGEDDSLMIEHAKEIAEERGKVIKVSTKLSGFLELQFYEGEPA